MFLILGCDPECVDVVAGWFLRTLSPLTVPGELCMAVVFPGLSYDTGGGEHWIGWSAGNGGFAVVFAPSAGFTDGTIVDAAVTSTETGSSRGCSPDQ